MNASSGHDVLYEKGLALRRHSGANLLEQSVKIAVAMDMQKAAVLLVSSFQSCLVFSFQLTLQFGGHRFADSLTASSQAFIESSSLLFLGL